MKSYKLPSFGNRNVLTKTAITGLATLGLMGCGLNRQTAIHPIEESRAACAGLDNVETIDGQGIIREKTDDGDVSKINLLGETDKDRRGVECTGSAYTGKPWNTVNSQGNFGISVYTDRAHEAELRELFEPDAQTPGHVGIAEDPR